MILYTLLALFEHELFCWLYFVFIFALISGLMAIFHERQEVINEGTKLFFLLCFFAATYLADYLFQVEIYSWELYM